METGATLDELIEGVQLEIGHSTKPTVGINFRDTIAARVRREYHRLHADFNWPDLLDWYGLDVSPGQAVYDLPQGIDLARVVDIYARKPDGKWAPLRRNLTLLDYNEVDTDANEHRDPPLKWRPKRGPIEIWPMPSSAGKLYVVAKSEASPMLEPDHVCDIDNDTVILFAAATLMFKAQSQEAGPTLQRARNRYDTVRQRLQTGADRIKL